jgi:hypothetical protein
MKFLQSHKNHPEAEPKTDLPKTKQKKNQANAKEEAISAYFTSVRPALAEVEVNNQAKEGFVNQLQDIDRSRENGQATVIDKAIPTVELADQAPYLGFGSRGRRHERGSSILWSESVRALSATPARPRIAPTIHTGQRDLIHNDCGRETTKSGDVLHSRPVPPTVVQCMTGGSGGRFQVSSLAPAYDHASRSHSLPRHTSSPRRMNLVSWAAQRPTFPDVVPPPLVPPFITELAVSHSKNRRPMNSPAASPKGTSLSGEVQDSVPSAGAVPINEVRSSMNRSVKSGTLSTLGRILEDCNAAFHKQRQAGIALSMNMTMATPARTSLPRTADKYPRVYPTIQQIPTVRFVDVNEIYPPRERATAGASIYEQQQERQSHIQQQVFDEAYDPEESFRFDDGYIDEEESYTAYGRGRPSEGGLDDIEFNSSPEDELVELPGVGESRNNTTLRKVVEVNVGFWRPHKLY